MPNRIILILSFCLCLTLTDPGVQADSSSEDKSAAVSPQPAVKVFDRLDAFWTFGNHEPISMYRRIGKDSTGGIQGSALWLEEWHHWFDSEDCPRLMKELGLNYLHCRFYKGMGWQNESKDFPNVKRFVQNCHRHGVHALAYVQFATLYYEIMTDEYPDLADWAAIDENGKKIVYGSSWFRWRPCINAPGFEKVLKNVIKIALTEGDFDGIMIDNVDMAPCYCDRCTKLFREYLATVPNLKERTGLPSFRYVQIPPATKPVFGEIQDPIRQEWLKFRCQRMTALLTRLYQTALKHKPNAIVTGNIWDIRAKNKSLGMSISPINMNECFNLLLVQSKNGPKVKGQAITHRIHEMKLAQAFGLPILALCDADAADSSEDTYLLPMVEDAVFGGIPTDRTIIKPDPSKEHVSLKRIELRRPLLERFQKMVKNHHDRLDAPVWSPIKILYSKESNMFSERAWQSLYTAEEVMLRHHLPYELLLTQKDKPLVIPGNCEILLVPDQCCLSQNEIDVLVRFAHNGGKLVITGRSGQYDSDYRQRMNNPLFESLRQCPSVILREKIGVPSSSNQWEYAPTSMENKLLPADLFKLWTPPIMLKGPETVFTEYRISKDSLYVHFVGYSNTVNKGTELELTTSDWKDKKVTVEIPLEKEGPVTVKQVKNRYTLPDFKEYAQATIHLGGNKR